MRLVVGSKVREHVQERGGSVYVWPRKVGCCGGKAFVLDADTEKPDREFELVHAVDGLQILTTLGLSQPDELHLELGRRGTLRAYWNGQAWIG
ncbi:MAG: hypothetical protein ABI783_06795 [Actinomycetota bacterium]